MECPVFGGLPRFLPAIGGMATMPSRLGSLRQVLPGILRQVDRLYLYLDKYAEIPEEFNNLPKLVPLLTPREEKPAGGSGKFIGLAKHPGSCLYFCFDDDILYPAGYVARLGAALRRHQYRAIVGLHGAVYQIPAKQYTKSRRILHFRHGLEFDCCVDELGTGTLAFHSGLLKFDHQRWANSDMSDLMLMIEAIRQGVPRIAIRRPENFLRPIEENQVDSLYRRTLADDSIQTHLLAEAQRLYPDCWCRSD